MLCKLRAWPWAASGGGEPLTFLAILSVVVVAVIANSGCSGHPPMTIVPSPIPITRPPRTTATITPTCTTTPTHTPTPSLTPTACPTATPSPTSTSTPSPPLMPAGTTTPIVYPAPELIGVDINACTVILKWNWPWQLTESEYFAVRAGIGDPGHSIAWLKDQAFAFTLKEPGEYVWEIAICRGDPATGVCEELTISEQGVFVFLGCGEKDPGPDRP